MTRVKINVFIYLLFVFFSQFQEMNIQQFEEFNREVQMMMNLHHRCIVQFIGASKVPGKLAILTEFVSGGNLQELLNSKQIDLRLKLKIALDVAEALQFLHANNILHRDIKAENVLVASTAKESSVNVKLTDFGTARSIVEEVTMKFTKGVGTPTYMAPGKISLLFIITTILGNSNVSCARNSR